MKKLLIPTICLICILSLCACSDKDVSTQTQSNVETTTEGDYPTYTGTTTTTTTTTTQPAEWTREYEYTTVYIDKNSLPEYVPGSVKLLPRRLPFSKEYPSFENFDRKYRLVYYLDSVATDCLSQEQNDAWIQYKQSGTIPEYGKGEFSEMLLVTCIKRFNISKKTIDEKIEYWKQRRASNPISSDTGDYIDYNVENYELPNTDIIYTFDNEIINKYYRYE
jgi:hypothetical protein